MSSEDAAKHEVWRLFVAIDLPDDVKKRLEYIARILREAGWVARWTKPETTHLTLRFFGNRPLDSVAELRTRLRSVLMDEPVFELGTADVGVFPNSRRPRVIWLGVQDQTGTLARIARAIEAESRRLGIEPEERPFRPHLTIARLQPEDRRSVTNVDTQFAELACLRPLRFDVDHVTLYRSDLQRVGALYTVVERFDFRVAS